MTYIKYLFIIWCAWGWSYKAYARDLIIERPPESIELPSNAMLSLRDTVWLSDKDVRFGGISGLLVSPDGSKLLAMTDNSVLIYAHIQYDTQGRIARLSDVRYEELVDTQGKKITGYLNDSEGLSLYNGCPNAPAPNDNMPFPCVVVSFEEKPRIYAYDLTVPEAQRRAIELAVPPKQKVNPNQGLESIRQLHDGRLLTVFECLRKKNLRVGFIGDATALNTPVFLPGTDGYCITDIVELPNYDLLALERAATVLHGWQMSLLYIPFSRHKTDTLTQSASLLQMSGYFGFPDNAEGIAFAGDKIFVISDDNFKNYQRTVLTVWTFLQK